MTGTYNNFEYFGEELGLNFNFYLFNYDFLNTNVQAIGSDSYLKNSSVFSGNYSGLLINTTGLNFIGKNAIQVQNATGLNNDFFTIYCAYEKTGSGEAILFSSLDSQDGLNYSGFNFGVTKFNNYYYEYFDSTLGPRVYITNTKANTAGIIALNKNLNNININIYNPPSETFNYEQFKVSTDTNKFNHFTIGSGKSLPYFSGKNYIGKMYSLVFFQESLNSTYLNELSDAFIYNDSVNFTFSPLDEVYEYSGLVNNLTGAIFDTSSGITFNCLNNYSFYDYIGQISGVVSGNITGSIHNATGFFTGFTSQSFNYTNSVERFFSNIIVTGSVTGYQLQISGTGLIATVNINVGEIVNICGSGIPLTFVSGITGVLSGFAITGIQELTGLSTGIESITNTTFNELINFPYSGSINQTLTSSVVTGKYVYNFLLENNGSYITKVENINFTNQFVTGAVITKTSNLLLNKSTVLTKNVDFLNSIGIEQIVYNNQLDNQDIVEIYAFEFSPNYSPIINQPAQFNIGTSRFRIIENQLISDVSTNGVYNINFSDFPFVFDYVIDDIANVSGKYDSLDRILLDYNKTGFTGFFYTGQASKSNFSSKDFMYLNGVKLISGYQYSFSGNQIDFVTGNIPVTGNMAGYNSILDFYYTSGNVYSYTLPKKYPKNTFAVYLNGIKQSESDYIQKSKFDLIFDPLFLENTGRNIYNTDNAPRGNQ